MPTIGEALIALESHLFVGREAEIQRFERWLTADRASTPILNVIGPGGVGKSALLGPFARVAEAHGRPPIRLDARDFRQHLMAF
jgi:ATP-dependent Clp protease ATP-binding subunit ClpA